MFLLHSTIPGAPSPAAPYHLGDTARTRWRTGRDSITRFRVGATALGRARGDAVFDTPPQRASCHGTCAELAASSPDSCAARRSDETAAPYYGRDAYTNIMDYAADSCMSEFTAGQATGFARSSRSINRRCARRCLGKLRRRLLRRAERSARRRRRFRAAVARADVAAGSASPDADDDRVFGPDARGVVADDPGGRFPDGDRLATLRRRGDGLARPRAPRSPFPRRRASSRPSG